MATTYNENIELCTISCLLKDPSLYSVVEDFLEPESFAWMPFGTLYRSFQAVVDQDIYPDVNTVGVALDRLGLLDAVVIPSENLRGMAALKFIESFDGAKVENIEDYAYQVHEIHALRQLRDLSAKVVRMVETGKNPQEILATIDLESGKISSYTGAKSKNLRDAESVAKSSVDRLDDTMKGKVHYVPSGLSSIDDFTGGFVNGREYVISAASNDGKSALVDNVIYNVSIEGVDIPVLKDGIRQLVRTKEKTMIISLEMSGEEVANRLVQIMTGLSPIKIEKGDLSDSDREIYKAAMEIVSTANIVFDDSTELILPLLRTKIRKAVAAGVKLIVIDQLEQLMIGGAGDNQPEYLKLNYISYRVKAFAREMDVPIILVHQMNRAVDSGQNRGKNLDPQLSDLAQAGEKSADAVLMIRHKRENQKIIESWFHWTKNRHGAKGKIRVEFEGKNIKFRDISESENLPEYVQDDFNEE